jgi:hypothetical protein
MSRSRNSRRGKKRSPRNISPAPKRVGNSYKCISSWCESGLSTRLTIKKENQYEIIKTIRENEQRKQFYKTASFDIKNLYDEIGERLFLCGCEDCGYWYNF